MSSAPAVAVAREDPLWHRLEQFAFDDPEAAFPFSARLARDNGWSRAYALEVVGEYRRFLYLAMRAGHPVTPSDEVDQAWHLHLCYTRSYWEDLCGGVLGEPLHHGPTKGGGPEKAKFRSWYAETLASYERLFGERPPRAVWPPGGVRFGNVEGFRRVNLGEVIVLPRGPVRRTVIGIAALGVSLAAGCGLAAAAGDGPGAVWGGLFILLILVAIILIARSSKRSTRGGKPGKGGRGGKGKGAAAGCGAGGCGGGGSADSDAGGDGGGGGGGGGCGGCGGCG